MPDSNAKPGKMVERLKEAYEEVRDINAGRRELRVVPVPPVPPIRKYSADEIRAIRDSLNMSQSEFAELLQMSLRRVQSWEQGLRSPETGAAYQLQLYSSEEWRERLRFDEPPARRRKPSTTALVEGAPPKAAKKPVRSKVVAATSRAPRKSAK